MVLIYVISTYFLNDFGVFGVLCIMSRCSLNTWYDDLYFRTVYVVIFILFKPTHALFLKHIHI